VVDLTKVIGFDWDDGNARKNERHSVSMSEAEQVFFGVPLVLLSDTQHSQAEPRFHALGRTASARLLHVTFALRRDGTAIRVISARQMHRKERAIYEQASKSRP
jgi:uncharacterized protein